MNLDLLTAISPIDGRYRGKTEPLANYFSEYALIRYRVRVEIEYFITLCELPLPQLASFDKTLFERLRDIYRNFDEACAARVKDIEKITNHDLKSSISKGCCYIGRRRRFSNATLAINCNFYHSYILIN